MKTKMNMKMKNKLFFRAGCAMLALFVSATCLASCAREEGEKNETSAPSVEEEFSPVTDKGEESELYTRYEEYCENSSLAFKGNEALGADSFEYEEIGGEIKINKYIGKENVIVIPENIDGMAVTSIGEGAFSGGGVGAVYIPDTVKSIAQGAFENCGGLTTLRLPFVGDGGEIGFLGHIFGAKDADSNAVTVPVSLDMVIVGGECAGIAEDAFRRCKALSAVVFEGETENVGEFAFYECDDLVYITLDRVIGEIGEYALAGCDSLYFADVSNAQSVGDGAFYLCRSLNGLSLNLSENEYLGRLFGADSHEFNEEFVPVSLRRIIVCEGNEIIPEFAFADCKCLTEVVLPESLVSVGVRAFAYCRSLGRITIPDGVKTVGDDAFFGCDAMSALTLGEGLESIGMQAFFGCKSLRTVEFPSSLKSIGASAFYGCESLEAADLPENVTVGKDAFRNCPWPEAAN